MTWAAQQGSEDRGRSRLSEDLLPHCDQTTKFQKYGDLRKGWEEELKTDDRQLGATGAKGTLWGGWGTSNNTIGIQKLHAY